MKSFVTSDQTLQVGDYVLSSFNKGNKIWKIIAIKRRFFDAFSTLSYSNVHPGANVGDEYNPQVDIQVVDDFSFGEKPKLNKKTYTLDASWVKKCTKETLQNYMIEINQIANKLWP